MRHLLCLLGALLLCVACDSSSPADAGGGGTDAGGGGTDAGGTDGGGVMMTTCLPDGMGSIRLTFSGADPSPVTIDAIEPDLICAASFLETGFEHGMRTTMDVPSQGIHVRLDVADFDPGETGTFPVSNLTISGDHFTTRPSPVGPEFFWSTPCTMDITSNELVEERGLDRSYHVRGSVQCTGPSEPGATAGTTIELGGMGVDTLSRFN